LQEIIIPYKTVTQSEPTTATQKNQPGTNQGKKQKKKLGNLHVLQSKKKKIANLFKHSNVGTAFKNPNTSYRDKIHKHRRRN
jgi:hypothetical protein